MSRKSFSIFSRLLIALLGVVVVTNGTLTTIFYVFSASARRQGAQERLSQQLAGIARTIHDRFQETLVREVRVLASSPVLDEFLMSSKIERGVLANAVERLFLETIAHTPEYRSISFVNAMGQEVIHVDRSGRIRT